MFLRLVFMAKMILILFIIYILYFSSDTDILMTLAVGGKSTNLFHTLTFYDI